MGSGASRTLTAFLLCAGNEMSVTECHLNIFVSEQFFYGHQIKSGHYKMRSERMPQIMGIKVRNLDAVQGCYKAALHT